MTKNNHKFQTIKSIFQIQPGDIVQVFINNNWNDLGIIKDKRQAQVEFGINEFVIMGNPARIIRKL